MKLSLRAQLLVVPAIVVAGAVTLATVLEHGAQRRWLIATESDQLLRVTREAARTAAPAADGSWQAFADSLDSRFALRATIITADGVVLADSRAHAAEMENHAGRVEVHAALTGHVGFGVRRSATLGQEFLYCAVPLAPPVDRAASRRPEGGRRYAQPNPVEVDERPLNPLKALPSSRRSSTMPGPGSRGGCRVIACGQPLEGLEFHDRPGARACRQQE